MQIGDRVTNEVFNQTTKQLTRVPATIIAVKKNCSPANPIFTIRYDEIQSWGGRKEETQERMSRLQLA